MHVPKQLWQALERVPGLAASAAEWRAALGSDWDWGRSLLRPTPHQVETVLLGGSVHRVVVHAPNRVVAAPVEGGRAQTISPEDIKVLEVNQARLAEVICAALGLEQPSGRLRPDGLFPDIGRFSPTRATTCPAHLCMQHDAAGLHSAIRRLLVEGEGLMLILTPTALDDSDVRQIVRMRSSCHLSLADSIGIGSNGQPARTEHAARALATFAQVVEQWESGTRQDEPFQFKRKGRVWVLAFDRAMSYLPHKDAGGLTYIQHLLARQGQEIPVERLEEMVTGNVALDAVSTGDAVVDREGLQRIWNEMQRVRSEIDAAERNGDLAAESRLQSEHGALSEQVRTMHGLNDRVRRIGDQTEQLRTKITNSIRRAIKALDGELPALAAHLNAIRCGRTMSYRPDSAIQWVFTSL